MSNNEVTVRFAPSPTGALHVGGVRTALYNYLFAKKQGGKMILRIEDTDQTRYVPGAEEYIFEALKWCGIEVDESPEKGGDRGPYRQSERKAHYREYAMKLVDAGLAYYAFDTPEELEAMREKLKAARVPSPKYNAVTRETMKNSLTLPQDEVQKRIDSGLPYVIRLKVPPKREVRLKDMVRGWVMVHSSEIDDKVLMKSDGMPTYHLANVVDDHLMGITHVIRGEEWLPSAPLHVLLYEYLGWADNMPQFAHLPLLLKPDGNGKLSKRDAEKHGFPIFPLAWQDPNSGEKVEGFRESGYLPDAFINFLAFLGWNPGTHEELFTLEELIGAFSVERIGKSGVKFDINKAKWYNQQYIKQKPDEVLAGFLRKDLEKEKILCDESDMIKICALMKERVTFPHDFWENGKFFFEAPSQYDPKVIRKKWTTEAAGVLKDYEKNIASLTKLDAASAKNALIEAVEKNNQSLGAVMQVVRVAITGLGAGPDLMQIIEIIGKDETLYRIRLAFEKIGELLS